VRNYSTLVTERKLLLIFESTKNRSVISHKTLDENAKIGWVDEIIGGRSLEENVRYVRIA
jgi:hypothetical protein